MKKVVGYIRISTTDQSNFSLDSQAEYISTYCGRQGYELLNIFRDNGQSAKDFDRANWKELVKFVKENYRNIDYLVVAKYDRFSRNLSQALQMIEKLEFEYNIIVLSVVEDMKVPPTSSMFFYMRAQMFLLAENELRIIKERTKNGMRQGAMQGRFMAKAPFGYINSKDDRGIPIIVPDEDKAFIVKKAFQLYVSGMPTEAIRKEITPLGYTGKGKSSVPQLLSVSTYAGLIKVPADNDTPEYYVDGIHTPLIDRATYYQAQALLTGRKNNKKVYSDAVPLRGVLLCECGKRMTASESKGRSKYYTYYRCDDHNGNNYNADKVHAKFDELVKHLSLPVTHIQALKEQINKNLKTHLADSNKERDARKRALQEVDEKIAKLTEKYIVDGIDKMTYEKFHGKWLNEKYAIQSAIEELQRPIDEIWVKYNDVLHRLSDMHYLYSQANVYQKQAFVNVGFKSRLYYGNDVFGTTYLLPIWQPKVPLLKEKRLLYYQQPLVNSANNSLSSPQDTNIEPILRRFSYNIQSTAPFECYCIRISTYPDWERMWI